MSTRTHIVLEDGLLERVDGVRGDVPRSKWIQRLIEERLRVVFDAPVDQELQVPRGKYDCPAPPSPREQGVEAAKALAEIPLPKIARRK